MRKKRIVYLLGAGASYEALPVVSEFSDALRAHAQWVENYGLNTKQYTAYLYELADTVTPYGTVDTYARGLFIQGGRESELHKLKLYLSLFLLLEHWHDSKTSSISHYSKKYAVDPRYMGWLALMMEQNGRLREGVNVLSWNYDLQLQKAMSRYMDPSNLETAQRNDHWFNHPPLSDARPDPAGLPFLVQLNGLAGYLAVEKLDLWLATDTRLTDVRSRIKAWLEPDGGYLHGEHELYPAIDHAFTFAWEGGPVAHKGQDHAVELMRKAEVLIAIGYSFPLFNREVDKKLLDAFVGPIEMGLSPTPPHHKRVIIQNSNDDAGEEFFEAFNWGRDGYPAVQHVKKVQAFHVPHELF